MFAEAGGGGLVYANGAPVGFPNMMPLISGPESLGFSHMVSHISVLSTFCIFPICLWMIDLLRELFLRVVEL